MPLNHYVTLGRSGLRVSPLCLGAMTFGEDLGWGTPVAEAEAIIEKYLALGGNFIDTANIYTFGHSETIIGDLLARTPGRRDRLVIATKFFGNLNHGDPNGGGAGRKSMLGAVEQSLRRLRTDYIDLYWMHAWDKHTPIEETMRGLDDLVRSGKVRYIGFSDTPAWKTTQAQLLAMFRGWAPIAALQLEYSLLERTIEGELIPAAMELGMGITPWSPLKGGLLSGKHTRDTKGDTKRAWMAAGIDEKTHSIIDELRKIAEANGTTPARAALAWVMARPGITSTIVGARTLDQLEQNLGAVDIQLSAEQMQKLNELTAPRLNFPAAFGSRAGGFMHGDITINGDSAQATPFVPKPGNKVW